MNQPLSCRNAVAVLLSGLLLSACGGNGTSTTNTPTSTLGTDSAAAKVGGVPTNPASSTAPGGMPAGSTAPTPAPTIDTGH